MIPKVLSIAGSDPSGGAGVQADLKTFSALGVYGMAALTSLTAQNTKGVSAVEAVPADFVRQQLEMIFDDVAVHAVKIGMIADAAIANVVADVLEIYKPPNVVLDPVMVASSGDSLIAADAMDVLKARLIPLADVITPNIPEAEKLLRRAVLDMEQSAKDLLGLGCGAVLLKGGHLKHERTSNDILSYDGGNLHVFEGIRILTPNTHGTGCTLSSAIAAQLSRELTLVNSIQSAKDYLAGALESGESLGVGHGTGPVHHFWKVWGNE